MISAYSVVWEPVSAPDDGDAARVDNEMLLRGMATPSKEGGREARQGRRMADNWLSPSEPWGEAGW